MPPTTEQLIQKPPVQELEPRFTVFVRLPFPRGDFIDPIPAAWDSSKDADLWEVLSKASKGRDIEWHGLADRFEVSLPFLLQQAAWLYERQLSQVKAQLRRVNKSSSVDTSPMLDHAAASGHSVGEQSILRVGSSGQRVPSPLYLPRPKEIKGNNQEMPFQTGGMRAPSRVLSSKTVHRVPKPPTSSMLRHFSTHSSSANPTNVPALSHPSSSNAESAAPPSHTRGYIRRQRHTSSKGAELLGAVSDADEDEEEDHSFLPFANIRATLIPAPTDPDATLRVIPSKVTPSQPLTQQQRTRPLFENPPQIHSSSSSAQSQPQRSPRPLRSLQSPRRTTDLNQTLSPRQRLIAKEGSEGTPSMGSSFSDLDDASVTQSALEEALANEMQHGGVASRMSQALRSRYL